MLSNKNWDAKLIFSVFTTPYWRLGGSSLYQSTEAQHQLLLVRSSSGTSTEGCRVTPTAASAAVVSAACLVLYCWYPEVTFL